MHGNRLRKSGFDNHGDYGAVFCLVSPIPQRNSLQLGLSTDRHNVLIVSGQIHAHNTVRVGIEEGSNGNAVMRIPNHEHAVFARVSRHKPLLVQGASSRSDLVAMTLQKALSLLDIVVNDTGV